MREELCEQFDQSRQGNVGQKGCEGMSQSFLQYAQQKSELQERKRVFPSQCPFCSMQCKMQLSSSIWKVEHVIKRLAFTIQPRSEEFV